MNLLIRSVAFAVLPAAVGTLIGPAQAQGTYTNQRVFVVPKTAPVTIDGDLKDWDTSGEILTYVAEQSSAAQSARTTLMYDADALYVGCRVADDTPMLNRHDPDVDPAFGWDADALQIRLSTDPTLPYPLNGAQYNRTPNESLIHLLFWYYTDGKKPVLQVKFGMDFHDIAAYPKGIVPASQFEGAYKVWPDGKGYTLEYRIPWTTLRAAHPPKAGDVTGATLQVQWSDGTGERSKAGGWAVDLMRTAGFSYQSTGCWGKMIYTKIGHLTAGTTAASEHPEHQKPLKFTYDLPKSGQVTIALVNEKGDCVRQIITAQPRTKGLNVETWDGLDDVGRVLPAGHYTYRAAYHDPISTRYVMSVGNSGTPGYHSPDGKGAWGGDWASPQDVTIAGTRTLLSWESNEAGDGIILLDASGHKQWGGRFGAKYLATDGEWLYAYLSGDGQIRAYRVEDGRQMNFLKGDVWAEYPDGKQSSCNGLAYTGGKLYASDTAANTVIEYDARKGTIVRRLAVQAPARLSVYDEVTLLVVTGNTVAKLSLTDGKLHPFIADHLDEPQDAILGHGDILVDNEGALQNVSVFDKAGHYVRSIGRRGGRARVGLWQSDGLYKPQGMAVDAKGRLWVAENDPTPKRVSIWDEATGKIMDEKFGACYVSTPVTMDPADPHHVYTQNVEWTVDLDTGKWQPYATIVGNKPDSPTISPHMVNNVVFTATNGKQYMSAKASYADSYILYVRRGDHFEGVAGIIQPTTYAWSLKLSWRDKLDQTDPLCSSNLFWTDLNGDGIIQQNETRPTKLSPGNFNTIVDKNLNFYTTGSYNNLYWERVSPSKIQANGVPIYDESTFKHVDYVRQADTNGASTYTYDMAVNPADGSVMMYAGADIKYMDKAEIWPLTYWSADGKLDWRYRRGARWYDAYEFPIPKPGELWGMTKCLGITDGITGFSSYHGLAHLMTTDGVILGAIMKDGRTGETGPDEIQCEWFSGQMVKTANGKWYILGGDQDGRVLEILGLNSVGRFHGTLDISDQEAKLAGDTLAAYSATQAAAQPLIISRTDGAADWTNLRGVSVTADEKRSFTAKLAYDAKSLHVHFDVIAPNELSNSVGENQLLFKGGNAIDLQMGVDPAADAARTKPAPGDIRVLITRRESKATVIVYRYSDPSYHGDPIVLKSPTGQETIAHVDEWDNLDLQYTKTANGFTAEIALPLDRLGWKPVPGGTVKMDIGYLFGNASGSADAVRKYWTNRSFTSGVTNDVPNESRIEPDQWGIAATE